MRTTSLLLWVAGCGAELVGPDDPLGAYFVVSGPLEPGLEVSGEQTRAAIAWVFAVDGELGGVVHEAPFEPRLFAYALTVEAPPDPSEATDSAPVPGELMVPDLSVLIGLPVLYEAAGDAPETLRVDPGAAMAWATGERASLADVIWSEGQGQVAAAAHAHLIAGIATADDTPRLSALSQWTAGGPLCRLDGLQAGLTLYRDDGAGCGGWRALAEPGDRTEFQGVQMSGLQAALATDAGR